MLAVFGLVIAGHCASVVEQAGIFDDVSTAQTGGIVFIVMVFLGLCLVGVFVASLIYYSIAAVQKSKGIQKD